MVGLGSQDETGVRQGWGLRGELGVRQAGVEPAGRGRAAGAWISPTIDPLSESSFAGDKSILSKSLATVNDVYPPA